MATATRTLEAVAQLGFEDGYQAALESGSAEPPVDGWDGWTINAIGIRAMCELLGEPERAWGTEAMNAKLRAYAEGAQEGANAAVRQHHA